MEYRLKRGDRIINQTHVYERFGKRIQAHQLGD